MQQNAFLSYLARHGRIIDGQTRVVELNEPLTFEVNDSSYVFDHGAFVFYDGDGIPKIHEVFFVENLQWIGEKDKWIALNEILRIDRTRGPMGIEQVVTTPLATQTVEVEPVEEKQKSIWGGIARDYILGKILSELSDDQIGSSSIFSQLKAHHEKDPFLMRFSKDSLKEYLAKVAVRRIGDFFDASNRLEALIDSDRSFSELYRNWVELKKDVRVEAQNKAQVIKVQVQRYLNAHPELNAQVETLLNKMGVSARQGAQLLEALPEHISFIEQQISQRFNLLEEKKQAERIEKLFDERKEQQITSFIQQVQEKFNEDAQRKQRENAARFDHEEERGPYV